MPSLHLSWRTLTTPGLWGPRGVGSQPTSTESILAPTKKIFLSKNQPSLGPLLILIKKKLQMLSFEGGGMGFRRTILLTRLSFWTTSTRNGRRKKGWRIGRIASRSRLNTREVACWLGQRESSSRPTTLLNRHRLIFSSKFDWFFASNPLILHCQSFIFFILLVAISIIRCSLRSTSNQSWGGSKLSHQQSLDLPLPGQQVEKGGKD